jgi:hypothetical protein
MLLAYEFVISPGPLELLTKIPYWASCGLLTFAGAHSDVAVRYDPA